MLESAPKRNIIDNKPIRKPVQKLPDVLSDMQFSLDVEYYEDMKWTLESMKPSFEDFFTRVIKEEPDYIILLDKGARPFGEPFYHFLKDLKLNNTPKIIFWNDDAYKGKNYSPNKISEIYNDDQNQKLHQKKLFFVDEAFLHGNGASLYQEFFQKNNVDGYYFAFSYVGSEAEEIYDESFKGDDRIVLYKDVDSSPALFTRAVAGLYVTDVNNKTSKRFTYEKDSSHTKHTGVPNQDELARMKLFGEEKRKETMEAIYQTLLEIKSNLPQQTN